MITRFVIVTAITFTRGIVTATLFAATEAAAQSTTCWVARRAPECPTYVVTEAAIESPKTTTYVRLPSGHRLEDYEGALSLTLGRMKNFRGQAISRGRPVASAIFTTRAESKVAPVLGGLALFLLFVLQEP